MAAPAHYRHRPTVVQAMHFTRATADDLERWLLAELGPGRFEMTATHLRIETITGDSRDAPLGWWVIKRRRHVRTRVPDIYPVPDEVMRDYERVLPPSHRRRPLLRRRAS